MAANLKFGDVNDESDISAFCADGLIVINSSTDTDVVEVSLDYETALVFKNNLELLLKEIEPAKPIKK